MNHEKIFNRKSKKRSFKMTIKELKPLTPISKEEDIKNNFRILYEYTGYKEVDSKFLTEKINPSYFHDPASTKYHGSFQRGLVIHSSNVALLTYKNLIEMRECKVSTYLNKLTDEEFEQYLKDSVFAGLFHDYCKVGIYKLEENCTEKQINFAEFKLLNIGFDQNKREGLGINIEYSNYGKVSIQNILNKCDDITRDLEAGKYKNTDEICINQIKSLSNNNKQYTIHDDFQIGHGEKSIILLQRLGVNLTDHQIYAIYNHMNEMDVKWELYHERNRILIHTDKIPMQKAIILAEKQSGFLYEAAKQY
jgi:hypothetical protein